MARYTLRRATVADVPTLVAHRRGMFRDIGDHTPAELAAADAPFRRWIRPRLASGRAVAWIAEARGAPAASGIVWAQEFQPNPGWRGARRAYLMSMYTEPGHRGRGLARRVVREALRWTRDAGLPALWLHASRHGRPIYEALGFVPTAEMKLPTARRAPERQT